MGKTRTWSSDPSLPRLKGAVQESAILAADLLSDVLRGLADSRGCGFLTTLFGWFETEFVGEPETVRVHLF